MMKLNINDYMECDLYCFGRSWWLKRSPDNSRRLIRKTLDMVALSDSTNKEWLTERLGDDIRRKHPRNPILVYILLHIILPTIIRLVVEWWRKRKGE